MRYPTRIVGNAAQNVNATVISAIACKLVGIVGYNNTTAQFLLVFNRTTAAPGGTTADFCISCAANSNFALALPDAVDMDGIFVALSSTPDTLTAVATFVSAQVILAG